MARNDPVPDEHELARWVKPKFLARDDDGNVEVDSSGHPSLTFPQAFELRANEEYLSLTNVDFGKGTREEQRTLAAKAIEASTEKRKLSKLSACAFAINVHIKAACAEFGHLVRVLEEPETENGGHVAVRRYPRETIALYEVLATNVFTVRRSISYLFSY